MPKDMTPEERAAYMREYRARQKGSQPAVDAPGSTQAPEPMPSTPWVAEIAGERVDVVGVQTFATPATSPILRTRAEKWADLQVAGGGDPATPPPAPKSRPASAPARKPVRVVKTADEAMSAIRRERAGNALPEPLPGMCMCGTGRPHRHYFDGWIGEMTDAQRKLVLERLAANHKADRFSR